MQSQARTDLVNIQGHHAFTTSLIIAENCPTERKGIEFKRTNTSILQLIKKYESEFNELGQVKFEILPAYQGAETQVALLNEDHATFLITLFTNTKKVVAFKLKLIKEFRNAINEINRLYSEPQRTAVIKSKRAAHYPMMDALKELRADTGKEMRDDIYMTESKLCNFIVIGRFVGVCQIGGEDELTNYEVEMLSQVRKRDEAYILAGLEYKDRKAKLIEFGKKYREKHKDPKPRLPLLELVD